MLLLYFVCVFITVESHSILRQPQAWNTRESKNNPCGGGRVPTGAVPAANRATTIGSTITGEWEITAGDGRGPVSIMLVQNDASATRNGFAAGTPVTMNMQTANPTRVGKYPFSFVVPEAASTCTGGADGTSCHLQFKSTSNWYSCMTLAVTTNTAVVTTAPVTLSPTPAPVLGITTAPTTAPTPLPTCSTMQVQGFCQGLNGKSVSAIGDLQALATSEEIEKKFNQGNPLVFRNGQSSSCSAPLEQLFCAVKFPLCKNDGTVKNVCRTRCEVAINACDLDPYHNKAFDCSVLTETVEDAYGPCPTAPTTRTINLKSRLVGLPATGYWAPGNTYLDMKLYPGDKLTFNYDPSKADVWKLSRSEYDTCSFTGEKMTPNGCVSAPTDGSPGCYRNEFVWSATLSEGGTPYYFASSISNACSNSITPLKVNVTVIEPPRIPTVTYIQVPNNAKPEVVTGTPTIGDPYNPQDFSPTFNSNSISITPCIATILWVLAVLVYN